MKELDFLPTRYLAALRRRRQNHRNAIMSVGLVLVMACLHMLNATRLRSAEASLTSLQNGTGGWQSARDQLAGLELRRKLYEQRAGLVSRLDDAAPLDAAIGEISQLLSESMAFRSLTVDARPPAPPAGTADPAATPPPAPGTRAVLVGVASSDVDVGIFLGKLGSCPLFSDVALSYSRETRGSGRLMREFEVKFALRPVEATR